MRGYQVATRDLVRAKSRIKAAFRARGIQAHSAVYDAAQRREIVCQLPPPHQRLVELLASQVEALAEVREQSEAWLLEEAKKVTAVKRLSTVPGIGLVRAAQIVAIVVNPTRFRTKQQFWSYSGFAIVTHSSSDYVRGPDGKLHRKPTVQTRGLNRNRNPTLKEVFNGAAQTVIQHMPKHPLHQDYQRALEANVKPTHARLTLARRIAAAAWAIWKKDEDYDPAKHHALAGLRPSPTSHAAT